MFSIARDNAPVPGCTISKEVHGGKAGKTEVDFVARQGEETQYYQVTASMMEQATFDREMAPLKAIADNYPKTILALDRFSLGNYDGIRVVNAIDWLLSYTKVQKR